MARRRRVPPRARRRSRNVAQAKARSKTLSRGLGIAAVLALAGISTALLTGGGAGGTAPAGLRPESAADRSQTDRTVSALFAGIPQDGVTLGKRGAPIEMEVFVDLEDPTSRWWFREDLPAIVEGYVRPGALKLRYHAFKRNTYWPAVFVKQQTAALAAGAQGKLWSYIDTFLYEQGRELTHYVTEGYLEGIARQIPGFDLARWRADRRTGRCEEQTTAEDQSAREAGLFVTPAFRIGNSGGRMSVLTGRAMIRYPEQAHPIALIEAADLAKAIALLARGRQIPPANYANPQVVYKRLE